MKQLIHEFEKALKAKENDFFGRACVYMAYYADFFERKSGYDLDR